LEKVEPKIILDNTSNKFVTPTKKKNETKQIKNKMLNFI